MNIDKFQCIDQLKLHLRNNYIYCIGKDTYDSENKCISFEFTHNLKHYNIKIFDDNINTFYKEEMMKYPVGYDLTYDELINKIKEEFK